ncbi:MAG: glycosyltransferase family 2 protein [Alphaproteobacteria bacterium]|nr:glycosyltransferase family 2 protein [Alphaproteobacteria bacterium]
MRPFFSVVIPVYNRAHLLVGALESVLAQTEQDFEIVVVDDGSTDDPKAVIDAFADRRIRYIRRANGGGGAARNTGLDEVRGDFVAMLDSDDAFLPNHLATQRKLLTGTADTVGFARIIVDRGGGNQILKPPRGPRHGEDIATYLLCDRGFIPTITTVAPAALARKIRYHENLREAEDADFAIRLALAGARFVMAEEPGAIWRDHYDPNRSSADRSRTRMVAWLEEMKPHIPLTAYLGGRGWAVAKGVSVKNPLLALSYYAAAVMHGCYPPKLAAIVALQVFLPDAAYRAVADGSIRWLRAGMQLPEKKIEPLTEHVPTERIC